MTDKKKTEVNLEMCSGFFRIPTDDIVYNITVLTSNEPSTTKVVEKIIEVEKIVEVEKKTSAPAQVAVSAAAANTPAPVVDEYYQQAARKFQQEIGLVADGAGAGGESDQDGIEDLAAMATDLKEVLLAMKRHPLLSGAGGGGGSNLTPALQQLQTKITQAQGLCGASAELAPAAAPVDATATKTVTRYLFNLDTVFQTIYELCTNETVKTHIKNARAKADEIFDKEAFYDAVSPKVSNYPEDDGFLNVPMTDIYTALSAACNDKAINNLLVKMDKQQADIFLDQFLLMEVPPKEEVTVATDEGGGAPAGGGQASQAADGQDGLQGILSECQSDLDALIQQGPDQGSASQLSEMEEFASKVDDAINIVASIQHDAKRLAAGAGANPLWLKIKSLAALAAAMLSRKEQEAALTYADGLLVGQAAAQQCLAENTPQAPSTPPSSSPKKEPAAKKASAPENFGEASQDDIDRLLEELG